MREIVKFKPSNHTQGDAFVCEWCGSCKAGQRDATPCGILARTMWLDTVDVDYPTEWVIDPERGPICTAHVDVGEPDKPVRCDKTVDMFTETAPAVMRHFEVGE